MSDNSTFSTIGDILAGFNKDQDKYISREFQKYGYDLAKELNDLSHKALYIKLAKENPRELLESARNYIKDSYKVRNKARLFMWYLKKLRNEERKK